MKKILVCLIAAAAMSVAFASTCAADCYLELSWGSSLPRVNAEIDLSSSLSLMFSAQYARDNDGGTLDWSLSTGPRILVGAGKYNPMQLMSPYIGVYLSADYSDSATPAMTWGGSLVYGYRLEISGGEFKSCYYFEVGLQVNTDGSLTEAGPVYGWGFGIGF